MWWTSDVACITALKALLLLGRGRHGVQSSRLPPGLCTADMSCGLWLTTAFEMVSMRLDTFGSFQVVRDIPRRCIRDDRDVHTWPVVAPLPSARNRKDRLNTVRQVRSGSEHRSNLRPLELRSSLGFETRPGQKPHPLCSRQEASRGRGEKIRAAYPRKLETTTSKVNISL